MSKQIEQHKMGSQGLAASMQGLGCMGITASYKRKDDDRTPEERLEQGLETVKAALDAGMNLFDTAWIYQDFEKGESNEKFLGEAIKRFGREKFVVCTKFGIGVNASGMTIDSSDKFIREQVEQSLANLGIDCIDLYYQHRRDPNTPVEDVMKTLKSLVEEGKIKYCGLSECSPDELRRAHAIHPVTAIQMEWSLWERSIEREIVPLCQELGIAIVAYSPLHRGFLSGLRTKDFAEGDYRLAQPRFQGDNALKNETALEKYDAFAKSIGCTPGQLALAWLHNKCEFVFPIPGTSKATRVKENIGGAFIKLSPDQMKELEELLPKAEGNRYDERGMALAFEVETKL